MKLSFFSRAGLKISRLIVRIQNWIELRLPANRLAGVIFYMFLSGKFRREQSAVFYGKKAYRSGVASRRDAAFLLRRNIHRLEKGLIMQPRRPVFALDYIQETVYAYEVEFSKVKNKEVTAEIKWAHDVLKEYFSVVSHENSHIVESFRKFRSIQLEHSGSSKSPFLRDINQRLISYEEFLALCVRRRSVRWFEQKTIPRPLIDKAIEAAAQAPSACNRQPFRFIVLDDPKLAQKVGSISMGTRGFVENFPALVVVVGDLSAYFHERDRHVIYIDASLASMTFALALETIGLSSCMINWPDIEEKERLIADALGIRPYERVVMLIAFGYPRSDGLVPYSQKRDIQSIRSYNEIR